VSYSTIMLLHDNEPIFIHLAVFLPNLHHHAKFQ